jgi:hypothetical protein
VIKKEVKIEYVLKFSTKRWMKFYIKVVFLRARAPTDIDFAFFPMKLPVFSFWSLFDHFALFFQKMPQK